MLKNKPTVLIVLDGWGYREETKDNAISQAKTPRFDEFWAKYPHTLLEASGLAVGLPEGQMGNSEIGHMTIGAGKTIDTDLVRIRKDIDSGDFANNPAFQKLFNHVVRHGSTLHVQGLLGDGGIHSHSDHLFAFLRTAKKFGLRKIAIHVFTDGRDTPPQSAARYIKDLETVLAELSVGYIATISGRFYAMDRDNNWDRLARAEAAIFSGEGIKCEDSPSSFVEDLYKQGKLDEHLEPIVCKNKDGWGGPIEKHDGIFFFNFRADRARMLSQRILEKVEKDDLCFATLTSYGNEFKCLIAYPPVEITTTLAKEISDKGLTQAHIAETEKFSHATYFLNGGVEKPYPGEKHILLDSRKDIKTHDQAPEMRAEAVADKAIEEINNGTDFIFINFANADMVGHTADVPAIIKAIEKVDTELGRVVDEVLKHNGILFVTADHGNAEINIDPVTLDKHTAHTTNPVPAILISGQSHALSQKKSVALRDGGTLADITPTILNIIGIEQSGVMTGKSLI